MKPLILASSSPYRKKQLASLLIDFKCANPLINEEDEKLKMHGLSALEIATRLARLKAQSLATEENTVIGGDQLAHLDGLIFGKPHSYQKAFDQLQLLQGRVHQLITATCVVQDKAIFEWCNITEIKLKKLSPAQIDKYLITDQPYDCSGSYKIEMHGLSLVESIKTDDFTAIQGLPLIELSRVLQNKGYAIPQTT